MFRTACKQAGVSALKRTTKVTAVGSPVAREELLELEVRELRSQLRGDRKAEILEQKLLDLVSESVSSKAVRYKPAPREKSKQRTPHSFFLQWSDIHASEVVDAEQINHLNEFNWDVMLARHERMRHAILSFKENRPYPVEALRIGALGDMLTGDIHDELRVTNEKVLMDATLQLAHDMGDWIESFVPEFEVITIDGVFGNHGRTTQKPSFKNAFNNWDWLFYKVLELRLAKYPTITFNVTKAAQAPLTIYNRRILLWHGDGVRSTMVDVPWGGLMRYCKKLSDTWRQLGQPIDHFAIGHWHETNSIRGGWIMGNGSIKGPDEYSLARFAGGHPAQQSLHTFHPKRGLTESCILDLAGS